MPVLSTVSLKKAKKAKKAKKTKVSASDHGPSLKKHHLPQVQPEGSVAVLEKSSASKVQFSKKLQHNPPPSHVHDPSHTKSATKKRDHLPSEALPEHLPAGKVHSSKKLQQIPPPPQDHTSNKVTAKASSKKHEHLRSEAPMALPEHSPTRKVRRMLQAPSPHQDLSPNKVTAKAASKKHDYLRSEAPTTLPEHSLAGKVQSSKKLQYHVPPPPEDLSPGTPSKVAAKGHDHEQLSSWEEEEEVEVKPKVKRKRRNLTKQSNGSWLSHVGSLLMLRCVQSAQKKSCDYRENSEETSWEEVVKDVSLTAKDIRTIWFFIDKEFEGMSLEEIERQLKPYSSISVERIVSEETKQKFKDQMPKAPLSAFMLYSRSVVQKFKQKYPNLTQREIATKIGEKWKSLPEEKQLQYRGEYLANREDYKKKMETFFQENPEAMPSRTRTRSDRKGSDRKTVEPSPETMKIRELRSLKPKGPTTAYMLYCKAKRTSLQKKFPNLSSREVTRKLSEKWKAMDETKRAKYRKQYIDYQCTYIEELKKFYDGHPEAKELLSRSRKKQSDHTAGANGKLEVSKEPPGSAEKEGVREEEESSKSSTTRSSSDSESDDHEEEEEGSEDEWEEPHQNVGGALTVHERTLTVPSKNAHPASARTFSQPTARSESSESVLTARTLSQPIAHSAMSSSILTARTSSQQKQLTVTSHHKVQPSRVNPAAIQQQEVSEASTSASSSDGDSGSDSGSDDEEEEEEVVGGGWP